MQLQQIQYFIQLYKDQNMTKASRALFISQQGLSKSISKLEKELGLVLFKRTAAGVTPTEYADKLYPDFVNVYDAYGTLINHTDSMKRDRIVRLVAPLGFSTIGDKDRFQDYSLQYPEYPTRYTEYPVANLLECLENYTADAAFFFAPLPPALSSHVLIRREPFYAIMNVRHPLAQKERMRVNDLDGQSLLLLEMYGGLNQLLLREASERGVNTTVYDEITSFVFPSLVSHSDLIGFGSKLIFKEEKNPELAYLPMYLHETAPMLIETHLVTLKSTVPDEALGHYIRYQQSIKRV